MLSHPRTARNGNSIASLGMMIAVITTVYLGRSDISLSMLITAIIIGYIFGSYFAIKVEMTQMPQLVAIFNGFGGGASALVASSEFIKNGPDSELF